MSDIFEIEGLSEDGNKMKTYKLPKFELKNFDGELMNWCFFESRFQTILPEMLPDLYGSCKFSYLVQSMENNSQAKEFIDSYLNTSHNCAERFGKSELVIEIYIRELSKIIISNIKKIVEINYPLINFMIKLKIS